MSEIVHPALGLAFILSIFLDDAPTEAGGADDVWADERRRLLGKGPPPNRISRYSKGYPTMSRSAWTTRHSPKLKLPRPHGHIHGSSAPLYPERNPSLLRSLSRSAPDSPPPPACVFEPARCPRACSMAPLATPPATWCGHGRGLLRAPCPNHDTSAKSAPPGRTFFPNGMAGAFRAGFGSFPARSACRGQLFMPQRATSLGTSQQQSRHLARMARRISAFVVMKMPRPWPRPGRLGIYARAAWGPLGGYVHKRNVGIGTHTHVGDGRNARRGMGMHTCVRLVIGGSRRPAILRHPPTVMRPAPARPRPRHPTAPPSPHRRAPGWGSPASAPSRYGRGRS